MFLRIITSGWFLAALVILGLSLKFIGWDRRQQTKQDAIRQEQIHNSVKESLSKIKIEPCPFDKPDCKKPGN